MKQLTQILPWGIILILVTLLLRCCSDGPTGLPPAYDSLLAAGNQAAARANDLDSGLTTARQEIRRLTSDLNTSQAQLNQERLRKRSDPRVVQVIREIPAVADAFAADDSALAHCDTARIQLQGRFDSYLVQDSVYHMTRDTVEENLRLRERIAVETLQDLVRRSGPWSLGFNAGLGAVYSAGQVHAGPGIQVGLQYRIPLHKRRGQRTR